MTADPFVLVLGFFVGFCATLLVMQFRDGDLAPEDCGRCGQPAASWLGESDGWLCVRCIIRAGEEGR